MLNIEERGGGMTAVGRSYPCGEASNGSRSTKMGHIDSRASLLG